MKKFALALMAVSAMVFGFGMVAEAQYGGSNPGASVPGGTTPPGGTIVISITGCTPGEVLTVTLNGTVVATVTCAAPAAAVTGAIVGILMPSQVTTTGTARISLTAPTAAGTYTYQITGNRGFSQSVSVTVGGVPGTGLPATGSDGVNSTLLLGLGLFGVGAGLFGVAQFRRRSLAAA